MEEIYPVILLIEDDPAHAEIFKRSFKKGKWRGNLIHVEDGQKALDYLFREGEFTDSGSSPMPTLIITDLKLPKVGGIELIRIIRSQDRFNSINIVVLSTSESKDDIAAVYNYKISSYLVKPMNNSDYHKLIETISNYWF